MPGVSHCLGESRTNTKHDFPRLGGAPPAPLARAPNPSHPCLALSFPFMGLCGEIRVCEGGSGSGHKVRMQKWVPDLCMCGCVLPCMHPFRSRGDGEPQKNTCRCEWLRQMPPIAKRVRGRRAINYDAVSELVLDQFRKVLLSSCSGPVSERPSLRPLRFDPLVEAAVSGTPHTTTLRLTRKFGDRGVGSGLRGWAQQGSISRGLGPAAEICDCDAKICDFASRGGGPLHFRSPSGEVWDSCLGGRGGGGESSPRRGHQSGHGLGRVPVSV
jgi:hypothetical protein